MVRFLCLLLAAGGAFADTITLQMRRKLPEELRGKVDMVESEEKQLPLKTIGCEGKARLRALQCSIVQSILRRAATEDLWLHLHKAA